MYSSDFCFFSKIFLFFILTDYVFTNGVFPVSREVLASFRLFSIIYKAARFFFNSECSSVETVECSKKALFCGNFCDRNQAIILVV